MYPPLSIHPFKKPEAYAAMDFLLIASLTAVVSAKSFLQSEVGMQSVERALLSELSGMAGPAQL